MVAPDHASATKIIAAAMTDLHPSWSGPLYVSLIGVSEDQKEPGLLGGPVWLASTDSDPDTPETVETPGELDEIREDVSLDPAGA